MRSSLVVLVLGGCATHDALHAEPVAARAVCNGGIAVYGFPRLDGPSCETHVTSLGDGCYLVVRPDERPQHPRQLLAVDGKLVPWAPHLIQCAPNPVDRHVMCVEDRLGRRDELFGEDIVRAGYSVELPASTVPDRYAPARVFAGRCRDRFFAWELAHVPPPASPGFVSTTWTLAAPETSANRIGSRVELAPLRFEVTEDAISLRRILFEPQVTAIVCPGPTVDIISGLPSRLAQRFATVFERAVTERGLALTACTRVTMAFAPQR